MKSIATRHIAFVLAWILGAPAIGASQHADSSSSAQTEHRHATARNVRMTDLSGKPLVDLAGRKVGVTKDVIIDIRRGLVLNAVVSHGRWTVD